MWGPEINGLRLAVAIPDGAFRRQADIPYQVFVQNVTASGQLVILGAQLSGFGRIALYDAAGASLPPNVRRDKSDSASMLYQYVPAGEFSELSGLRESPGWSISKDWSLAPGTYRLSLSADIETVGPPPESKRSEPITLTAMSRSFTVTP